MDTLTKLALVGAAALLFGAVLGAQPLVQEAAWWAMGVQHG